MAAPINAPFRPPKMPPSPALAAVVPPMIIAVFFQSRRGARSTVTTRRGARSMRSAAGTTVRTGSTSWTTAADRVATGVTW